MLWLACLVLGVGGAQTTQAISNFGLIAAAASAGVACLVTARSSTPQHVQVIEDVAGRCATAACRRRRWCWR